VATSHWGWFGFPGLEQEPARIEKGDQVYEKPDYVWTWSVSKEGVCDGALDWLRLCDVAPVIAVDARVVLDAARDVEDEAYEAIGVDDDC